jgi:hypothetical protein
MDKKFVILGAIIASLVSSAPVAQAAWVAKKQVRLTCASLPYVFDCSIPLVQNPQFTSKCFYVAGGQSSLMKADHRMGFSNGIVNLQVNAGMTVTGVVTDSKTGSTSECTQEED